MSPAPDQLKVLAAIYVAGFGLCMAAFGIKKYIEQVAPSSAPNPVAFVIGVSSEPSPEEK